MSIMLGATLIEHSLMVEAAQPHTTTALRIEVITMIPIYINVGKQIKSGLPCARERYAIDDIEGSEYVIFFVPYN